MKKYLNKEFLLSNKDIIIKAAAVMIIIVVAFFVFVLGEEKEELPVSPPESRASVNGEVGEETESSEPIMVDVGGAVQMPQVVELKPESRVADAVSAAGGLKENADTKGINQAAFLKDGEKIYIPQKGEMTMDTNTGLSMIGESNSKVNLNTATSEELQELNGVGPATAEKILAYRSNNGTFKNIEELKNVKGIGDKTFEKLKEQIMV